MSEEDELRLLHDFPDADTMITATTCNAAFPRQTINGRYLILVAESEAKFTNPIWFIL